MNDRKRLTLTLGAWTLLVVIGATLTVLSLVWPTWWESLTGESPDAGSGSFERLLAVVWLAMTVLFARLAQRDLRALRGLAH